NPLSRIDPRGLFVDTPVDFGFIGYDIYRLLADNVFGNRDNLQENFAAFSADIAGACIPGATGLGLGIRAVERGGRAVESLGGRLTESGFLNATEKFLGKGYKEISPGRFVSADSLRQVRFGPHEVKGPGMHAHFEAYNQPGGKVIENKRVLITPDAVR
ncbi:MAG: hypothetical protein ACRERU_16425, partial [Methylococcales bacterium]